MSRNPQGEPRTDFGEWWLHESEMGADDVHIYGPDGDALATIHGSLGLGFVAWDIATEIVDAHAALRAIESPAHPETGLDAAWREAEAALPEGWQLAGIEAIEELDQSAKAGKDWTRSIAGWRAKAMPTRFLAYERIGIGPTPAAALRDLAAALGPKP